MNPKSNFAVNYLLILITILDGSKSRASLILNFRKLAKDESPQVNASPGPLSSARLAEAPIVSPAPGPSAGTVDDKCLSPSNTCHDGHHLTVCIIFSSTASNEVFLLTKNDGNSPLKVKVTILHSTITFSEIQAKINISESFAQSQSVILNAGNGDCIIHFRSSLNIFKQFPFYFANRIHIYGPYLIFFTAFITGITWAYCKRRKSRQQDDKVGVAYQELEMGKQDSHSAADQETAEGWNQDWDEEWDEMKILK